MSSKEYQEELNHTILLREYNKKIKPTDKLPKEDINPVLLGLFGEVGSIMATAKKLSREKEAYSAYRSTVEEEFGDAFWYFTVLCNRLNIKIEDIFSEITGAKSYSNAVAASDLSAGAISHVSSAKNLLSPNQILLNLGETAAALLGIKRSNKQTKILLCAFADQYIQALQSNKLNFSQILNNNISKTRGRFLSPDRKNYQHLTRNLMKKNSYQRILKSGSLNEKVAKAIYNGTAYLLVTP